MKQFVWLMLFVPFWCVAQVQEQEDSDSKDAPIHVHITDFKKNASPNEIIVFRSVNNGREYQGISGEDGKFSTRLPAGDKYEIFILGFKDSTSYNVFEIPALDENAYYKDPFKVDIQFEPSRTFVLEDCNFETGKALLEPESYTVIDELVNYLKRKTDQRIEIGGHTDNVGSAASNKKLSEERANAVRSYIISRGIEADRVTAKGYGMSEPVADNKTEEGRAMNRRTEVKLID